VNGPSPRAAGNLAQGDGQRSSGRVTLLLEGDLVSEGFELGDEPTGLAFGLRVAVEVVGAELVIGSAGGQDMPVR
jgi:hypothetical protein